MSINFSENINSLKSSTSNIGAEKELTTDLTKPSDRTVNPVSNTVEDKQIDALSGLASVLGLGNNDSIDDNDDKDKKGLKNPEKSEPTSDDDPNLIVGDKLKEILENFNKPFKGDRLFEFETEEITEALSEGKLEPLLQQVEKAIQAGIDRSLQIVLQQIAPSLINSAVDRATNIAQQSYTSSSNWAQFVNANPEFAEHEKMIRPTFDAAMKNSGDYAKTAEAIVTVYGHAVGLSEKEARNKKVFDDPKPFNLQSFLGG